MPRVERRKVETRRNKVFVIIGYPAATPVPTAANAGFTPNSPTIQNKGTFLNNLIIGITFPDGCKLLDILNRPKNVITSPYCFKVLLFPKTKGRRVHGEVPGQFVN